MHKLTVCLFAFCTLAFSLSCKKKNCDPAPVAQGVYLDTATYIPSPDTITGTPSDAGDSLYFSCKMYGKSYSVSFKSFTSYPIVSSSLRTGDLPNGGTKELIEGSNSFYVDPNTWVVQINFSRIGDNIKDTLQVNGLYTPGFHNYGDLNRGIPGVQISLYYDNEHWTTAGPQEKSWFKITEHRKMTEGADPFIFGTKYPVVTKAKFFCRVYNDEGDYMELSEGSLRVPNIIKF